MLLHKNIVGKNFDVALLGDIHLGNIACLEDKLDSAISMIGENNWYWGCMGDAIEGISILDPRFSPEVHGGKFGMVSDQCLKVAEHFMPIKKRCLFWLEGNHETKKTVRSVMKCGKDITGRLGIEVPVAFSVKIQLAEEFKLYATHGRLSVNSMAGDPDQIKLNESIRIKRKLRNKPIADCHVAAVGHIHKLRTREPFAQLDIYGIDKLHAEYNSQYTAGHSIHRDSKYYISTGSFLKSVVDQKWEPGVEDIMTYVEENMYDQTELGFQVVHVRDSKVVGTEEVFV